MNAASLAGKAAPAATPKSRCLAAFPFIPFADQISGTRFSAAPSTSAGPPGALPDAYNPLDGTPQGNPLLAEPEPVDGEPPQNVSSISNDPSHSAEVRAVAAATEPASHLTGETARVLPPSELPAPHAPGSQPVPPNPYAFTLEPPTTRDAESIYDFDMKVMNASGQPWRARGSDMSRWFNYGFDEFTWKRYCEYRRDMVKGIEMMVRTCSSQSSLY
jgi:pre-mRNA 3'-end-processing factor FIP1